MFYFSLQREIGILDTEVKTVSSIDKAGSIGTLTFTVLFYGGPELL